MCNDCTAPDDKPDPASNPEEYADWLFDSVSSTLRDRPGVGSWARPSSRATKDQLRDCLDQGAHAYRRLLLDLVSSDSRFDELHEWIMSGRSLPDPWRKHYVPRHGAHENE